MTRDEVIKELNSSNVSFSRVKEILMYNAALRAQFKEEVISRREEEVLIDYFFEHGTEDKYIEDRVAASAFFYRYRTLQMLVEELYYIYAYVNKSSLIFKANKVFTETNDIDIKVTKELPEILELSEYKEEILELYGQTRISLKNIKIKVKELQIIIKHYFTGIDEFKKMIDEEKLRAQSLTTNIIKLSKELKLKYNIPTYDPPNHLRSYSQESIKGLNVTTKISELINP